MKIEHLTRMYNLAKVSTYEDLSKFVDKDYAYCVFPKYDGIAVNLIYKEGTLRSAATRGDGWSGLCVTQKAEYLETIPYRIPYKGTVEIRGKLVISKNDLLLLNVRKRAASNKSFATTRTASIKLLQASLVESGDDVTLLKFIPYSLGYNEKDFLTHSADMEFIRSLGFSRTERFACFNDYASIQQRCEEFLETLEIDNLAIDGVVVCIDDKRKASEIGYTLRWPKFVVAMKPDITFSAELMGISHSLSRYGLVTPIASLLSKRKMSKCTLNNYGWIREMGLRLGDTVAVSSSSTPAILRVEKKNEKSRPISPPRYCHSCREMLYIDQYTDGLMCLNMECPAVLKARLTHFASGRGMDIMGFSKSSLSRLYDLAIVGSFLDIFKLKVEDFKNVRQFRITRAKKIVDSIQDVIGNRPVYRFIYAISMPNTGLAGCKEIAACYKSTEHFMDCVLGYERPQGKAIYFHEYLKQDIDMYVELIKIARPFI